MTVYSYVPSSGKGKKWMYSFYDETGTRQRRKGYATKSEAQAAETRLKALEMAGESLTLNTRKTVQDCYDEFVRLHLDVHCRAQTGAKLKHAFEKDILPYFGKRPVRRLAASDMRAWMAWMKEGRGCGSPASVALTRKRWKNLRTLLNFAVSQGDLGTNPQRGVVPPKAEQKERVVPLTIEQVHAIADAMTRDRDYSLILFMAYTAMRPGEAFALHWDDVDLERGVLTIRASYCPVSRARKSTKTDSVRTVKLGKEALSVIRDWRNAAPDTCQVFPARQSRGTGYIGNNWYRCSWKPAIREAGVGESVTLYALRHFLPSLLLSRGAPIKSVQDLLGHSSAMMTLDVYGHCMPGDDDKCAAVLDLALEEHREDKAKVVPIRRGA